MQYIDKTKGSHALSILDEFLNQCWNSEDNEFKGANYSALPKEDIRKELLNNQNAVCCYCMKELQNDRTTTLEHIIPQEVSKGDFLRYINQNREEINNHVIHKDEFERHSKQIPPLKYPHDIAYHNLIASCNSNSHCNNYRKDKYLQLLMFDKEVASKVEYDANGIAGSFEYSDELDALGVSTSAELRVYRFICCEIAKNYDVQSIEELTEEEIDLLVLTITIDGRNRKFLDNFYGNPSKKHELLKYKWFINYYRNQQ